MALSVYCFMGIFYLNFYTKKFKETYDGERHVGITNGRSPELTTDHDTSHGIDDYSNQKFQPHNYLRMADGNETENVDKEVERMEDAGNSFASNLNLVISYETYLNYPPSASSKFSTHSKIERPRLSDSGKIVIGKEEEKILLEEEDDTKKQARKLRKLSTSSSVATDHSGSSADSGKLNCRTNLIGKTKRVRRDVFLYNFGAHNLISRDLPAQQLFQKLLTAPLLVPSGNHDLCVSFSAKEEDNEQDMDVTLTGDERRLQRKRKGKTSDRPIKRSEEAKKRRREKAKIRNKHRLLRKKLEAASIQEKVEEGGKADPLENGELTPPSCHPPQDSGKTETGQAHPRTSGERNQPQTPQFQDGEPGGSEEKKIQGPQGNGASSSKPPPNHSTSKKKGNGKKKKNHNTKVNGNSSVRPPLNQAQPKPQTSGQESPKKQRKSRPIGTPHHVFARLNEMEIATEEARRKLMEDLAIQIAGKPTTPDLKPIFVTDSRLEPDGSIRLSGPNQYTADGIRTLLREHGGVTILEGPGRLQRYSFGGPGYMNKMRLDYIQRLFENQNPGLPLNSIRVISVDNGGKNPLFFADVTEEGYSYLLGRNFSLDSMTSKVLFRQVGGKQEQ